VLIRQLIQRRLESPFQIFNREGTLLPCEQVRNEYRGIRQYLLDHHADDCIAIRQQKDYRYFLTILACMEIGIPYIPMKYDYPMDRVEQIREDANFTLLMDDSKMNEILAYNQKKRSDLPELSSGNPMYIIFTSGSTGRPKGVIIQRGALENFFLFMDKAFPKISATDHLLQVTEFTFDISLVDVAFFLNRNVALHFSNFENNIFKLAFEIETNRISVLNTVPNNLNMFLSELVCERMDYKCLKHLFIGGARFSYGLYQKCLKYFERDVEIYNFYGPTEATVYCHVKKITYQEPIDTVEGNVSIGRTLPGVKAHIVVDGQIAGPHQKGELFIGGNQLMKEYINNHEQTVKALVSFDGEMYYKSGDLAFRSESEEYFIVGRADDTIKYRGFRINLLDIDSYITRITYVQDSVTIAIPNEATENQTIGFLILKEEKSVKEIKKDLSSILLDYQIPEKIIFIEKFPINVSGKVCRKTLKSQYLESLTKAAHES
jgi:acyl-coenzyme A synthetase/AMP-(fatty) acid ligase